MPCYPVVDRAAKDEREGFREEEEKKGYGHEMKREERKIETPAAL